MKPALPSQEHRPTDFYNSQSLFAGLSVLFYLQYSDPHLQQKDPNSPQSVSVHHSS